MASALHRSFLRVFLRALRGIGRSSILRLVTFDRNLVQEGPQGVEGPGGAVRHAGGHRR